ncbi:unnamed protein product [Linum trigynum]|uniref:Uncharacterized protein n=1 Tax=Linum trigynum TaxID=586398 RepID=A0AAV2DMM1_9ROSI
MRTRGVLARYNKEEVFVKGEIHGVQPKLRYIKETKADNYKHGSLPVFGDFCFERKRKALSSGGSSDAKSTFQASYKKNE